MDRVAGIVLTTQPVDIWNGPAAEELRDLFLDQSFKHCSNCGNRSLIKDKTSPYDLATIDILTLSYDSVLQPALS